MQRNWTLALMVLLLASAGCDTKQPTVTGDQTFSVDFTTSNAVVTMWDLWDVFNDTNPKDGQPDDTDGDGEPELFGILCRESRDNMNNRITSSAGSVPWYFAVEIEVIRAGSTVSEQMTTVTSGSTPSSNQTPFDDRVLLGQSPACPANVGGCPPGADFLFLNPRRMSSANQFLFEGAGGPQRFDCPNLASIGNEGLNDPAGAGVPPRSPLPFEFTIGKGDTVVVRARRGGQPPGLDILSDPSIVSRASVGGQQVALQATQSTPGAALSYVVTAR